MQADESPDNSPVAVSVVVPVYNPGDYIEPCIDSLLAQTLPTDQWEVIFVDDGSTDATPARLDALAAEHSNVRVLHREASGWSGTPRNDGIEASHGEYVQFLDQDDLLGREALERLYARARSTGADIVIGRAEGFGRPVAIELMLLDSDHVSLWDAPLIDSLTPHKMFRRAFLDEHGLRFPGGRRRLEDHVFVSHAYFHADVVSVVGDYVCYFHTQRDDGGNAGFHSLDPAGYFGNLREALDVVDAHTEPGPRRDRLHRRWLINEIVRRSRGRLLLSWDDSYRHEMLAAMIGVVQDRIGPGVDELLSPATALVTALLRAGDEEGLLRLARWESQLHLRAAAVGVDWRDDGLHLRVRARLEIGGREGEPEAQPMPVRTIDETSYIDLPAELIPAGFDSERLALQSSSALGYVTVREREAIDRARHRAEVRLDETPVDGSETRWTPDLILDVVIDPGARSTDSQFAPGPLDLYAEVRIGGWTLTARVELEESVPLTGALLEHPPHWLWPYRTSNGCLSFGLQHRPPRAPTTLAGTARLELTALGRRPRAVVVEIPEIGHLIPGSASMTLRRKGIDAVLPVTRVEAVAGPDGKAHGSRLIAESITGHLEVGVRNVWVGADADGPQALGYRVDAQVTVPQPRSIRRVAGAAARRAGRR